LSDENQFSQAQNVFIVFILLLNTSSGNFEQISLKKKCTWLYGYSTLAKAPEWGKMDSRFRRNDSVAHELIPIGMRSDLECGILKKTAYDCGANCGFVPLFRHG